MGGDGWKVYMDYESMSSEALQNLSEWLYDGYLAGEDNLDDLHRIAEVLRSRSKEALQSEGLLMEKILAAGASIIIRPAFQFMGYKYVVAIEFHGVRNGLNGDDLEEIFARAWEWVAEVDFYNGTEWTLDQVAKMDGLPV